VTRASTGRGRKAQLPLLRSKEIATAIIAKAVAIPTNAPFTFSVRKNYSFIIK